MSNTVIQVDNLSKYYRLGVIGGKRLVEDFGRGWAKLWGKPDPISKVGEYADKKYNGYADNNEAIWALKDISFDVREGEVLGVIGRNGAGKSTLFKILSRVTAPSLGEVRVKGRIASLLEVGTGFQPDLTGRENVFLNGAILGMTKSEIRSKFDEIVEFAEISKFIDTPVKRYSSGMYVRLAFAVAAHLEPEILIVDEVLAVGDAEFQKKCLGKMGDVASQGRTVLFVSHNMAAVQTLCRHAVLLREGRLAAQGNPTEMIAEYLESLAVKDQTAEWESPKSAPGNDALRIKSVKIETDDTHNDGLIGMHDVVTVQTEFWCVSSGSKVHIAYHLVNEQGVVVLTTGAESTKYDKGLYRTSFQIPGGLLNSGIYHLKLLIIENGIKVTYTNSGIASFNIVDRSAGNATFMGKEPGVVQPIFASRTESLAT